MLELVSVICALCGYEATVLKTVRPRAGGEAHACCDPCWEPLRNRLWIVPGPVACFGRCGSCSEWFRVGELIDRNLGGGHGAWIGTCVDCAG